MVRKYTLAIALAVVAISWGVRLVVAAPPIIPTGDRRFDHARHATSAASASDSRRRNAACGDCHKFDAKGIRVKGSEHATRCVKCHDNPKTCSAVQRDAGTPRNPARRCDVCHRPTGTCKLPTLPPKPASDTYQARFAHGEHIGFKVAIEQECAKCHPQNAPANAPKTDAHALCVRCHNVAGGISSKLLFNNCQGCHQPPRPKAGASGDPFRIANFDHRKHHTQSRQASCTGCHQKMSGTDKDAVPRPAMAVCMNACHDGTPGKAFSAVGTECTKCHRSAGGINVALPQNQVFSHAKHVGRNTKIDGACTNCHSLKDDGSARVEPPNEGRNHMPCAASGCHQTEFMSRTVKICGVCHDKANPWEKTVARIKDRPETEFFENMNHASHLKRKGTANASCADCHGDKLGGGKAPKDHEACAECHGKGPPAHAMTECDKCHTRNAPTRQAPTEWSVAATFVHTKHSSDPRSRRATVCTGCHKTVGTAKTLAEVARPTMESCEGCHNGKGAFKATGFECSRCHTRANNPSTPSAMRGLTSFGNEQAMLDPVSLPIRGSL